jgi:hypothetical protein
MYVIGIIFVYDSHNDVANRLPKVKLTGLKPGGCGGLGWVIIDEKAWKWLLFQAGSC